MEQLNIDLTCEHENTEEGTYNAPEPVGEIMVIQCRDCGLQVPNEGKNHMYENSVQVDEPHDEYFYERQEKEENQIKEPVTF